MSNIDFSQVITVEEKAARESKEFLRQRRAQCRARILALCDEATQINLAAAAAVGAMSKRQTAAYRDFLHWVHEMRASCSGGEWPEPPASLGNLAAEF